MEKSAKQAILAAIYIVIVLVLAFAGFKLGPMTIKHKQTGVYAGVSAGLVLGGVICYVLYTQWGKEWAEKVDEQKSQ